MIFSRSLKRRACAVGYPTTRRCTGMKSKEIPAMKSGGGGMGVLFPRTNSDTIRRIRIREGSAFCLTI